MLWHKRPLGERVHFKRFVMILRSAGFVIRDLIGGQNTVNSAYVGTDVVPFGPRYAASRCPR
jgi:hypothetical protein